MSEKSKWSPISLLANLVAVIGVAVLGTIVGLIGFDQFRHWADPDFVLDRRARHDFFCFEQSGLAVMDRDNRLLILQEDVEILLDVARQELTPTDFIGKIKRFALCAEFTGFSVGGIRFAGPALQRQQLRIDNIVRNNVDNPVLKRRSDIDALFVVVPNFPPQISEQIDTKLAEMLHEFEEAGPDVYLSLVQGPLLPAAEVIVTNSEPDAYLLVVGADKSEAATINQHIITKTILDAATNVQASGPPEVYRLGAWERTAIPFATKDAADAALTSLRDDLPYGGYVRERAAWCENATKSLPFTSKEGEIQRTVCDA